jgi:5'-methylthioinosine phosphorylase
MSAAIDFAVIGGTGLYALAELTDVETREVETAWGKPSAPLRIGGFGAHRIAFLARHG